jgi:hypothetical protein
MASSNEDDGNPYQSPLADTTLAREPLGTLPDPDLVKKFRQQIHALGAFWIIIGGVAVLLVVRMLRGTTLPDGGDEPRFFLVGGVVGLVGFAWIVLGVLACLKNLWAVYVGLVLSYASVLLQLLSFNICSIVILIIVILQAHRVIGWGNKMRAAGIPLNAV